MTPLTDELLVRIRDGSGRVYSHEAKAMAAELLVFREARNKALSPPGQGISSAPQNTTGGFPFAPHLPP